MHKESTTIEGISIPVYSANTLIIGSGTASLNAAVNLHDLGQHDIAIVTEQWGGGTSNNAGSDKQTYYKSITKLLASKFKAAPQYQLRYFGYGLVYNIPIMGLWPDLRN